MIELYVDRSTETQSVALAKDGAIACDRVFEGADSRSGDWVMKVREFLETCGAGIKDLDRIVVGIGPGSFAGIRAALAFAQGVALGSKCEVKGLPSANALAAAAEGPFAVVGDARRGMYWIALFDGARPVVPVFQVTEAELGLRVPLSAKVVTPDAKRIDAKLKEIFEDRYLGGRVPLAVDLARAARESGARLVDEPLPLYLNPAVRD